MMINIMSLEKLKITHKSFIQFILFLNKIIFFAFFVFLNLKNFNLETALMKRQIYYNSQNRTMIHVKDQT